jgi:cytochrome c556
MRALAILIGAAAVACAPAGGGRYRDVLEDAPAPAAHAVHSERLVEVMRGLAALAGDRLPQAMDLQTPGARRREEIASVARAMADSADALRGAAPDAGLDDDERAEFAHLATRLRDDASALAAAAESGPLADLPERAEAVRDTCRACHRSFGIPGVFDGS